MESASANKNPPAGPRKGTPGTAPARRPAALDPLFQPVTLLSGVGTPATKALHRLTGPCIVDLLWHLPAGVVDRSYEPTVASAEPGRIATITLEVVEHVPSFRRGSPYRVRCRDPLKFGEGSKLDLVFFHVRGNWLSKLLPKGETRIVSGKVESFNDKKQIAHPDLVLTPDERHKLKPFQTIYPLSAGISQVQMDRWVAEALERAPELPEWIDPAVMARENWPDWNTAIHRLHAPGSEDDLSAETPWRRRAAFDELLANQLALLLVRERQRRADGRPTIGTGVLRAKLLAALPYTLTGAQTRTLAEIDADLAEPHRMLRLLQGDVGSGKTVVALLTMLAAVEAGRQAVLMAPTEILARQHLQTIEPLATKIGVRVGVLTGRDKGKARSATLLGLAEGTIQIAVGTHALTQDPVTFRDLAVVVVDEQHRFGVDERMRLSNKGRGVDTLVMTATPIPRTLTLTAYGDMEVSRLDEKPPGRRPIDTRTVPGDRIDEVVAGIERAIRTGARVYWVCPLVEESETSDLAAARERAAELTGYLSRNGGTGRVGLVHGRMKGPEKDAVMAAFATGELDVLVATTVIEVGVNVPEATIMVIEHAERFGLAQLHQLRGRVGRGDRQSSCVLLYSAPLNETAKQRLTVIRETEDGFRIAEEDLQLRGSGDLLGTKQSGQPDFRLANLEVHADLLQVARDDARLILSRDPELSGPRAESLRTLLYLFERDAAVKYLRSG